MLTSNIVVILMATPTAIPTAILAVIPMDGVVVTDMVEADTEDSAVLEATRCLISVLA